MPYLRIQTNASVRKDQQDSLLSQASQLVSRHLGKDEKLFMGIIEDGQAMYFAGSSNPLAFLELKALGLPAEATKDLSRDLCSLVHEELSITPERIYVRFHNVNRGMWGWNGGIF
ncbi:MAG: phenylpyruvate tautomerase MIF-related protein [Roseibacillus sp.]